MCDSRRRRVELAEDVDDADSEGVEELPDVLDGVEYAPVGTPGGV